MSSKQTTCQHIPSDDTLFCGEMLNKTFSEKWVYFSNTDKENEKERIEGHDPIRVSPKLSGYQRRTRLDQTGLMYIPLTCKYHDMGNRKLVPCIKRYDLQHTVPTIIQFPLWLILMRFSPLTRRYGTDAGSNN